MQRVLPEAAASQARLSGKNMRRLQITDWLQAPVPLPLRHHSSWTWVVRLKLGSRCCPPGTVHIQHAGKHGRHEPHMSRAAVAAMERARWRVRTCILHATRTLYLPKHCASKAQSPKRCQGTCSCLSCRQPQAQGMQARKERQARAPRVQSNVGGCGACQMPREDSLSSATHFS